MKWLEIIELRSAGKHQAQVQQGLADLTAEADPQINVYRNMAVNTDWSIHLHHESHRENIHESPLGLRMAEALREFGLVHHSVWLSGRGGEAL